MARGVVVTALVQSLVRGIGLWIAGVPFATLLTALMFLLAVAQIGAVPVLVLAVIWLFWSGSAAWGTFLIVVTVIGGLIAVGLVIFIGPLVLAVTHTLLRAWLMGPRSNTAA